MYVQLATRLFVTDEAPAYSRAVEVTPEGTVEVQATAVFLEDGVLQVHLETSDASQDWKPHDPNTYLNFTAVGFGLMKLEGIAARFARLKFLVQPIGEYPARCVCAAAIRTDDAHPTEALDAPGPAETDPWRGSALCPEAPYPSHLLLPTPPAVPLAPASPPRGAREAPPPLEPSCPPTWPASGT